MLMKVLKNGERIILQDDSEWIINPADIPTVCTWTPTAELSIIETNSGNSFPYKITNMSIGISVYAAKFR